jgi:hypothetical protein
MKTCKTIVIQGKRYKLMHGKIYSSCIKYTKGLQNLNDPRIKPMTHRIVRSKMKREIMKDVDEYDIENAVDGLVEEKMAEHGVYKIRDIPSDYFIMTCECCEQTFNSVLGHLCVKNIGEDIDEEI